MTARFKDRRPLRMKSVLIRLGLSQSDLTGVLLKPDGLPYSRTAMAHILNHGYEPTKCDWPVAKKTIEQWLATRGATPDEIKSCWDIDDNSQFWSHKPAGFNLPHKAPDDDDDTTRIEPEMLSPQAKRHFNLFRDPFQDDVQGPDDIFLSADQRYIREAMFQAANQGGWMIAVVGESGSGKTTLRRETIDRIQRESRPVMVIQPKAFDKSQLTARHICEAILYDLQPNCKPKRT